MYSGATILGVYSDRPCRSAAAQVGVEIHIPILTEGPISTYSLFLCYEGMCGLEPHTSPTSYEVFPDYILKRSSRLLFVPVLIDPGSSFSS